MVKSLLFAAAALLVAAFAGLTEDERRAEYYAALKEIDFDAVKQDIADVLTTSQDFFPADYGHYGPFMVRMAWHCAGTYRQSDGEGGCEGGRQRFDPERSWSDNTNLDKARQLLEPIKLKYGVGLSWGDLFSLTGNVALEIMGTPLLGFCAGRVDDVDGTDSIILGPSDLQEEVTPCELDGNCTSPFGAQLLEHIYVNPGGFLGNPDPAASIDAIRDVFGRMGMNDTETVALVGGGHTFGKMHGACMGGPGPSPKEDPENPWPFPNQCGNGEPIPSNFLTSGYEGPWTTQPLNWTQLYFRALVGIEWELGQTPAGLNIFLPKDREVLGPSPDGSLEETFAFPQGATGGQSIAMLVTDISFIEDETYLGVVNEFATDFDELSLQFAAAWYKLTTRDMGPVSRCFGNDVPEAQPFQGALPEPYESFSSIEDIESVVEDIDTEDALLIEAAYLCAATFRDSDHFGGCNGGRIRSEPERSWPERAPLAGLISELNADGVSSADVIVGAGTLALQKLLPEKYANVISFSFCPLRSDVPADEFQTVSESLVLFQYDDKIVLQQRHARLLGLSLMEYVALQGRPRSSTYMRALGYSGSYTMETSLSNAYARILLENTWTRTGVSGIYGDEFVNEDGTKYITFFDFVLTLDDDFSSALFELATNEALFLETFEKAWTQIMNADRFDGPVENLCTNGAVNVIELGATSDPGNDNDDDIDGDDGLGSPDDSTLAIIALISLAFSVMVLGFVLFTSCCTRKIRATEVKEEHIKAQDIM